MFISASLFEKIKKDFEHDMVELGDNGRVLLINGEKLVTHTFGEVIEKFHQLTVEAQKELYTKIKAEAEKLSKFAQTEVSKASTALQEATKAVDQAVVDSAKTVSSAVDSATATVTATANSTEQAVNQTIQGTAEATSEGIAKANETVQSI